MAFISLPFMIPVLIFGVSAVNASVNNIDAFSELYFLAGMISIGVFLSPLVTKYALRVSMEYKEIQSELCIFTCRQLGLVY